jgi:hypothetical protein
MSLTRATVASFITYVTAMVLACSYQSQVMWWLLGVCAIVFLVFGTATYVTGE